MKQDNVKKIYLWLGLGLLILTFAFAFTMMAPRYVYLKILRGQWPLAEFESRLDLESLRRPIKHHLFKIDELKDERFWNDYHFFDTFISLPSRHPNFEIKTVMYWDPITKLNQLKICLYTANEEKIVEFSVLRGTKLNLNDFQVLADKIPYFSFLDSRRASQNISWNMIFEKNLKESEEKIDEMIENLKVLTLRNKYFPLATSSFSFDQSKNIGVLRVNSRNKDFSTVLLLKQATDQVLPLYVSYRKGRKDIYKLVSQLIRSWRYEKKSSVIGEFFYKQFLKLPRQKKFSSEGALLLVSSWSHNEYNPKYPRIFLIFKKKTKNNEYILGLNNFLAEKYKLDLRDDIAIHPEYQKIQKMDEDLWIKLSSWDLGTKN